MMKLAAHCLCLGLCLGVVIVTSCSVDHKSGEYACTKNTDCMGMPGRVCSEGFCVVPNGAVLDAPNTGHPDAPGTHADAASCPVGCSSCDTTSKTCNIECGMAGAANCGAPITCPTGWSCNIDCKNQGSCRAGIDCTNAKACTIACSGAGSCRDIVCGDGACSISCTGAASCNRNLDCQSSCACDIACINQSPETCVSNISCGNACSTPQGGCTSSPLGVCSSTCP